MGDVERLREDDVAREIVDQYGIAPISRWDEGRREWVAMTPEYEGDEATAPTELEALAALKNRLREAVDDG